MHQPRRTLAARARVALVSLLVATAALQPVAHAASLKPRPGPIVRLAARKSFDAAKVVPRDVIGPGRLGATRALAAMRTRAARAPRATPISALRALAQGAAILGPTHTLHAMRRNPKSFAAGLAAIGAIGAGAEAFGFHGGHIFAVGISLTTLVAQFGSMWSELRMSRGLTLARVVGSEVVWPTALFAGTTIAGIALESATTGHAVGPTLTSVVGAFFASMIIGVDAPAVGVTALDNLHHRRR
jgi:hypothetical protein